MKQRQAFKFELMPNGEQSRKIRSFAGCGRFVFNNALALQKKLYEAEKKKLGYGLLCKRLTEWRNSKETSWLANAPSQALQQSLKDLERAYTNFFAKRAQFPRFKKKGQSDSFRFPDPKQFKLDERNARIFLPKLGWMRYRKSRETLGELRNITVSFCGGKYFVSIQTEREVTPVMCQGSAVGIDMGIKRFATLSNGTHFDPLNSFRKFEAALRKAQRSLSRKEKSSNNRRKAKEKVRRIHARIRNARGDYLHKITHIICKNHAVVCIEDLQVKNLSKSAKGTLEEPGNRVRAKSGLNKSILDQGWYEFRRELKYKLEWRGGQLVVVHPHYTSQTCPQPDCRYQSSANRLTQEKFKCIRCGFIGHADEVAAYNVLERAGHAQLACGDVGMSLSMKQEPTEANLRKGSIPPLSTAVGISFL